MSTAIALQTLHPQDSVNETGGVRRRRLSNKEVRVEARDSDANSDWVLSPHDTPSSQLPLDGSSFTPTHTYWLSPHGLLAKDIKILDLTPDITLPYVGLTNAYKDHVKKTLKDHSFSPVFTVHRGNWWGLKYTITGSGEDIIAEWKHPFFSTGEAVVIFPKDSQHCSHTVSLKNKRWGFRTEAFTVESQPFEWKMDALWHSQGMTLYKVFGSGDNERRVEVGKYAQKWWGGFVTGGTLVVDEREIDGLVACLTLMVVLKKKRQRQAERSNGGGD